MIFRPPYQDSMDVASSPDPSLLPPAGGPGSNGHRTLGGTTVSRPVPRPTTICQWTHWFDVYCYSECSKQLVAQGGLL